VDTGISCPTGRPYATLYYGFCCKVSDKLIL